MDLIQYLRRSPQIVHFCIAKPDIAKALAQQADQHLTPEVAHRLSATPQDTWIDLANRIKSDSVAKRLANEAQSGSMPVLTQADKVHIKNTWAGEIESTLGPFPAHHKDALVIDPMTAFIFVILAIVAIVVAIVLIVFLCLLSIALMVAYVVFLIIVEQKYSLVLKGGNGGAPFQDDIPDNALKISRIQIKYVHGDVIRAIRVDWLLSNGATAPGKWSSDSYSGKLDTIELGKDEFLMGIQGRADNYVRQLTFKTNTGSYGPFGGSGGEPFELAPSVGAILGFVGRAAAWMDAIGVLSDWQRLYYGGLGGLAFSDDLTQVKRILWISVRYTDWILALQTHWELTDGTTRTSASHGRSPNGHDGHVLLDLGEHITEVSGYYKNFVERLTFKTNKGATHTFGWKIDGTPFRITLDEDERLLGFFGRADYYLDGIGPLIGRREGTYRTQTRFGANQGEWVDGHLIKVTDNNEVLLGNDVVLYGTLTTDGQFEFPRHLNPEFEGKIHFKPRDTNPYFWGTETIEGPCFTGSIRKYTTQPETGFLDFRGRWFYAAST